MPAPPTGRFPYGRLLVLAGAIFVSVSSEFLPTGLLPDIAADLRVSESRVGLLVSVFAFTVVLSATPLTFLTRRFDRKWLLVTLLGVFALSNVFAALAPNYELLAAARILGGLAHGLFWAVVNPYTAFLVPRHQLARAISVTTAGGTFAFIGGVPFTAALGHALGWRLAFAAMAVLVVAFAVLTMILLPTVSHRVQLKTGEIAVPLLRDRTVVALAIVAMTVLLVATGHNLFYTYIAPWSIDVGRVPADLVSVELLFLGGAGAIGLVLAGMFGDRWPRLTVNLMVATLIASIVLMARFADGIVPVILLGMLWSAAFGGLPALFSARSLDGTSPRVREYAGAIVTTAFNSAIGLGALFGGLVLDHAGIAAVPWWAAGIVAVGFAWVLATDRARIAAHPPEHGR